MVSFITSKVNASSASLVKREKLKRKVSSLASLLRPMALRVADCCFFWCDEQALPVEA
jgi:hypothetical protein